MSNVVQPSHDHVSKINTDKEMNTLKDKMTEHFIENTLDIKYETDIIRSYNTDKLYFLITKVSLTDNSIKSNTSRHV